MALATEAARRFAAKLNSMLDKRITVVLTSGKEYVGKLVGIDATSMSLVLEKAESSGGAKVPLVFIYGSSISEIILTEESIFDAKEFAEFLEREGGIGRHLIKVYEDINVVEVSKNVRVSKDGVEGSGVLAQRIHTLFMEYMRQKGGA